MEFSEIGLRAAMAFALGRSMKLPALRRQFAQQVGEVNQVLGDQVADFARTLCGGKSCQVDAFV